MTEHQTLVLASKSPRRRALLAQIFPDFTVDSADIDETEKPRENPYAYTRRVARAKAEVVAKRHPNAYILAADTPVICGRQILQTPETEGEAAEMLRAQSGRKVYVPTAVCLITPAGERREKLVKSWLKLKKLSADEIQAYLDANLWQGRSGAIDIESSEVFLQTIHGSYSGIIGLPLYETACLLRGEGLHIQAPSGA